MHVSSEACQWTNASDSAHHHPVWDGRQYVELAGDGALRQRFFLQPLCDLRLCRTSVLVKARQDARRDPGLNSANLRARYVLVAPGRGQESLMRLLASSISWSSVSFTVASLGVDMLSH
eukprot:8087984-Pyramimonas_sp.AAC.1